MPPSPFLSSFCIAFPRYKGAEGVERWASSLVGRIGVLLLPSSIYASKLTETPTDRFRIGYGRADLKEGLAATEADFLHETRSK